MTVLADAAAAYAATGWEVFPLAPRSKIPLLPHAHRCRGHIGPLPCCEQSWHQPEFAGCKGECSRDGHGVLDATIDIAHVTAWWSSSPNANIGGRVPESVFVVDVDPRHNGLSTLAQLELEHGALPITRTAMSGRGDGGRHLYWQDPGGEVTSTRLGDGLDVKTPAGYCVLPPSIHPDSGARYAWTDPAAPIAAPPEWLVELLRAAPVEVPTQPARPWRPSHDVDSIADWYSETRSWHDLLPPHGWYVVAGDGDRDGSAWRHPTATSKQSATVRNGCLFVYSTTPGLPVTETGTRHGLTRFRAFTLLEHRGDSSAAARAARQLRNVEEVFSWVSAS